MLDQQVLAPPQEGIELSGEPGERGLMLRQRAAFRLSQRVLLVDNRVAHLGQLRVERVLGRLEQPFQLDNVLIDHGTRDGVGQRGRLGGSLRSAGDSQEIGSARDVDRHPLAELLVRAGKLAGRADDALCRAGCQQDWSFGCQDDQVVFKDLVRL